MTAKNRGRPLVWLVCASAQESQRASELSALGYRVVSGPWSSPAIIRKKSAPPSVVVIDLSRAPSAGRDIAVAMRSHSTLVMVPFVLVDGSADKVAAIAKLLPDAIATTWAHIDATLKKARMKPPTGGKKLSVFAAYEGKSLADKLGIKMGTTVASIDAPPGLRAMIGALPEGAKFHTSAAARDLSLWFVRTPDELRASVAEMRPYAASGRLWIMWRKGDAALNQTIVRKAAMAAGMVDFRIARIDEEWSGLRFTIRK